MDHSSKRPLEQQHHHHHHHHALQHHTYGARSSATHNNISVGSTSTGSSSSMSAIPVKRSRTSQSRSNTADPNSTSARVSHAINHHHSIINNNHSNNNNSSSNSTPSAVSATTAAAVIAVADDNPKLSKQFLKARPSNTGPGMAADFVKFFMDPPHAAKLQHPGQQRDRVVAVFIKRESLEQTSTSGTTSATATATTTEAATTSLEESAEPAASLKYRKLTFTVKRINQLRIFLAALFLQYRLRTMARLSEPNYAFRISVNPGNPLFENLADELTLEYTKNYPSIPSSSSSSSSSILSSTATAAATATTGSTSLFKGVTGHSLLGLYSMLVFRARELEAYQASTAGQSDPWTSTRLSNVAMDLLVLDRQVRQRQQMQTLMMGKDGGGDGIMRPPATYSSKQQDWEKELNVLLEGEQSIEDEGPTGGQIAKSGRGNYERQSGSSHQFKTREQHGAQGVEYGWDGRSSSGSNHYNRAGPGVMGEEGDEGEGLRDDLWESVTVHARAFQVLTEEVMELREEAAGLREEASRLREEVAQLRRKDVKRDSESKARIRDVEDKLASMQDVILKMQMAGREWTF
ncbi:MAG: hypothetical protein J3R72DRAFT_474750 [Linnemannia gamsii]|nr:MAG: hypothetical protein J3R72DRAFT_474750 [Linnemannia gamsii]